MEGVQGIGCFPSAQQAVDATKCVCGGGGGRGWGCGGGRGELLPDREDDCFRDAPA